MKDSLRKIRSYNGRLLPVRSKGLCGDPEYTESPEDLQKKVQELAELIFNSLRVVAFTGAGISTSAGIPDFRGPTGVWTREKAKNPIPVEEDTPEIFEKAQPSSTHRILKLLLDRGMISHIISQNVDGLHLRSGVQNNSLTDLHGNIFLEKCEDCGKEYFRDYDVGGMGCKRTGSRCDSPGCSGWLRDCAIDWDTELPEDKFKRARHELDTADAVICLGTSLRIRPAGLLPLRTVRPKKKRDGRCGQLVIINLQATDLDRFAHIRIHHYCDTVMEAVYTQLETMLHKQQQCSQSTNRIGSKATSIASQHLNSEDNAATAAVVIEASPVMISPPKYAARKRKANTNIS